MFVYILTLKRRPLRFSNGRPKAYSSRVMITDKSSQKIVMEVKRSDGKEADEGWSILGYSNPQPSGTRYTFVV